jgi:hypothetical protein
MLSGRLLVGDMSLTSPPSLASFQETRRPPMLKIDGGNVELELSWHVNGILIGNSLVFAEGHNALSCFVESLIVTL